MIEAMLVIPGVIIYLLCLTLPLPYRLLAVLVCSVPQLYFFQLNGADIPLAFLLSLLLIPEFFIVANRFLAKTTNFSLLALVCMSAISLFWSTSPSMGLRDIAYFVEFIILSAAVYKLALTNLRALYKIINFTLIIICLQAVTIILFRLNPELELSIVLSPISKYFMGENTLNGLLNGDRNNFYDPVKAGGVLFVNANAAACYTGISSFMAWGIYKAFKTKISLYMGLFLWLTVFFTGSKAGILLAIFIPLFIIYLKQDKTKRTFISFFGVILACSLVILMVNFDVVEQQDFISQSAGTAETRYEIWTYALSSFIENPLIGQGFGGWESDYSKNTDYYLPPHNTLIYLWSKSGIIASLLGVLFMLSCIGLALKGSRNRSKEFQNLNYAFLMVITWLFAHGFGENFGLIGEQHQMVILAIMLGMSQATTIAKKESDQSIK